MLALGALLASARDASAQSEVAATAVRPKYGFDIGGGFATIRANASPGACGCFFMMGESAHASLIGRNHLATVADFGMTHKGNINGTDYSLTLQTYTIGERYQKSFGDRAAPFAQALFGIARSKTPYLLDNNKTSIAVIFGVGLDMKLSSRFAVRLAEADYLLNEIPNGQQNSQNQLRITTGVVYRIR
jgi:hypothetical protein